MAMAIGRGADESGESSHGPGDGALLERFATLGDASAFEALIGRHGPLVLGICRGMLGEPRTAEDAFLATFLVLARNARSTRKVDALAPWFFSAAYRVAARIRERRAEARRRRDEEAPLLRRPPEPRWHAAEAEWSDQRARLYEEIDRLPDAERAAVVLCFLEGLSPERAAGALGLTRQGVLRRLGRARARLKARLSHRGLAPLASLLGSTFPPTETAVTPPASLVVATLRAATAPPQVAPPRDAASPPTPRSIAEEVGQALESPPEHTAAIAALLVAAAACVAAGVIGLSPPAPAARDGKDDTPPARAATTPGAGGLRYAWEPGHTYVYEVTIRAEGDRGEGILRGAVRYQTDEAGALRVGGDLRPSEHGPEGRLPPLGGSTELGLDEAGTVVRALGSAPLPFLLGDLSELALIPLPAGPGPRWGSSRDAIVTLGHDGEGPALATRSPFARATDGSHAPGPAFAAREVSTYTLDDADGPVLTIRRGVALSTFETVDGQPRARLALEGTIAFHRGRGIPLESVSRGELTLAGPGSARRIGLVVECRLVEGEPYDRIGPPLPPSRLDAWTPAPESPGR